MSATVADTAWPLPSGLPDDKRSTSGGSTPASRKASAKTGTTGSAVSSRFNSSSLAMAPTALAAAALCSCVPRSSMATSGCRAPHRTASTRTLFELATPASASAAASILSGCSRTARKATKIGRAPAAKISSLHPSSPPSAASTPSARTWLVGVADDSRATRCGAACAAWSSLLAWSATVRLRNAPRASSLVAATPPSTPSQSGATAPAARMTSRRAQEVASFMRQAAA
mmetsp:Transcript_83640/g.249576  ORF Transcript_83640/g.249576 Transcript_83640/m.249576 type:complete len:229 (-) Transcript_83640:218-904(-)